MSSSRRLLTLGLRTDRGPGSSTLTAAGAGAGHRGGAIGAGTQGGAPSRESSRGTHWAAPRGTGAHVARKESLPPSFKIAFGVLRTLVYEPTSSQPAWYPWGPPLPRVGPHCWSPRVPRCLTRTAHRGHLSGLLTARAEDPWHSAAQAGGAGSQDAAPSCWPGKAVSGGASGPLGSVPSPHAWFPKGHHGGRLAGQDQRVTVMGRRLSAWDAGPGTDSPALKGDATSRRARWQEDGLPEDFLSRGLPVPRCSGPGGARRAACC